MSMPGSKDPSVPLVKECVPAVSGNIISASLRQPLAMVAKASRRANDKIVCDPFETGVVMNSCATSVAQTTIPPMHKRQVFPWQG